MKNTCLLLLALIVGVYVNGQTTAGQQAGSAHAKQAPKAPPLDAKMAAIVKAIDAKMIKVDGGTFTMGCVIEKDTQCSAQEKPRHTVTLNTFYVSKFDVTQKEWKDIMGTTPAPKYCAECPVINVTWFDAQQFINKLNQMTTNNYRLPTEAEWEYAAKGGNTSHGFKYAGGNEAMTVAWYDSTISKEIHPVGQKTPNELGLYDMSGDVWQWCSDWFNDKYYSNSPSNNPTGPTSGKTRCVRGGSWWGPLRDCRVANRDLFPPDSKDDDVGFRIVRN